jgi:hypothetical protein
MRERAEGGGETQPNRVPGGESAGQGARPEIEDQGDRRAGAGPLFPLRLRARILEPVRLVLRGAVGHGQGLPQLVMSVQSVVHLV